MGGSAGTGGVDERGAVGESPDDGAGDVVFHVRAPTRLGGEA